MVSRELVKRALEFITYEVIPTERHDVIEPCFTYGLGKTSGVSGNKAGVRTDEWGVEWIALQDGVCGEVKHPLFKSWEDLKGFKPPYEVLENADLTMVNKFCKSTDKFTIPFWRTSYNLFERMQHIRGTENLFIDIAQEEPEMYKLRDVVHNYFMKQAQMWVKTDIDGLHIADDWGTQSSLLINPKTWQKIFKPCYAEFCKLAHEHNKYVLMHSDGNITSILKDLAEIGVNAVNSQLFCMDMEKLAKDFNHKIAFWGEIDRQYILPFGTKEDCKNAVRKVADTFFKYGRTGVIGQAYGGKDIPQENLNAVYEEWKKI